MYSYAEALPLNDRYMDALTGSIEAPGIELRSKNKRYVAALFVMARRSMNMKQQMRNSLIDECYGVYRGYLACSDTGRTWQINSSKINWLEESLTSLGGMFSFIGGMLDEVMERDELLDFIGATNRQRLPENSTFMQACLANCVTGGVGKCVSDYVRWSQTKLGQNDRLSEYIALKMEADVIGKLPAAPSVDSEWKLGLSNLVCKMRRTARKADETRDALWDEKWRIEREMRKLEGGEENPFKARSVAHRSLQAEAYDEPIKRAGGVLSEQAERMILLAPHLDAAFSLDELFDLFNVNVIERAEIRPKLENDTDKTVKLLAIYSGENSATTRGQDSKSGIGGQMMTSMFMKMRATEHGRQAMSEAFDEHFGDMFKNVRKGYVMPDGSFELAKPEFDVIEGGARDFDDGDLSPSRTLH